MVSRELAARGNFASTSAFLDSQACGIANPGFAAIDNMRSLSKHAVLVIFNGVAKTMRLRVILDKLGRELGVLVNLLAAVHCIVQLRLNHSRRKHFGVRHERSALVPAFKLVAQIGNSCCARNAIGGQNEQALVARSVRNSAITCGNVSHVVFLLGPLSNIGRIARVLQRFNFSRGHNGSVGSQPTHEQVAWAHRIGAELRIIITCNAVTHYIGEHNFVLHAVNVLHGVDLDRSVQMICIRRIEVTKGAFVNRELLPRNVIKAVKACVCGELIQFCSIEFDARQVCRIGSILHHRASSIFRCRFVCGNGFVTQRVPTVSIGSSRQTEALCQRIVCNNGAIRVNETHERISVVLPVRLQRQMTDGLVTVNFAQHQVFLRITLKRVARRVAIVHIRALGQRPARKRPARAFRIRNSNGVRAGNLADGIRLGSSHAFSKSAALQVVRNGVWCQNQFEYSVLTRLNLYERRFQRVAVHGNPALRFLVGIHAKRNVGLAIIRCAVVFNEHGCAVINVRYGVLQIIKRHVAKRHHVICCNCRQIQELRSAAYAQVAFVTRCSQCFIGELDNLHVLTDGSTRLNRGNLGLHAVMHCNVLDGIRNLRALYPASVNRSVGFNRTILVEFHRAIFIGVPTREIITRVVVFQFLFGGKQRCINRLTLCHLDNLRFTSTFVIQMDGCVLCGQYPLSIQSNIVRRHRGKRIGIANAIRIIVPTSKRRLGIRACRTRRRVIPRRNVRTEFNRYGVLGRAVIPVVELQISAVARVVEIIDLRIIRAINDYIRLIDIGNSASVSLNSAIGLGRIARRTNQRETIKRLCSQAVR